MAIQFIALHVHASLKIPHAFPLLENPDDPAAPGSIAGFRILFGQDPAK